MHKSLKTLYSIMLFDHTCVNIAFPVMALIFFDTHSNLLTGASPDLRNWWYGLCISVPHILTIFAGPFLSMLSDNIGRRKILLITSLGAASLTLLTGLGVFFGLIWLVLTGRIVGGLISRTNPVAQAIVGDVSTPDNKIINMGYLQFFISVGAFIGPVIGGLLASHFFFHEMNYSTPFFLACAFGIGGFIVTYFFFEETLENHHPKSPNTQRSNIAKSIRDMLTLFKNPVVLNTAILLLISQLSWSLYYQFTPPVLVTVYKFKAAQIGLFVGLIALWLALTTGFLIKPLKKKFSLTQMMYLASLAILFGLLLTISAALGNKFHPIAWVGAFFVAFGDVLFYTCVSTRLSSAVEKNQQGKVMGLCFIIVSIAWAITGLLGAGLMSVNPMMPLIVAPVGIVVLILMTLKAQRS